MSATIPERFPAPMREVAEAAARAGLVVRPLPDLDVEVISLRHPAGHELAILWQMGRWPCLATAELREISGDDRIAAWLAGVDVTSSGC